MEKSILEKLFKDRGFPDFKWIEAKDIVVAQWVRFRCMFGCPVYGKKGTCPPNVPSIDECRKMISEYNHVAVIHFEKKLGKSVPNQHPIPVQGSTLIRNMPAGDSGGSQQVFVI